MFYFILKNLHSVPVTCAYTQYQVYTYLYDLQLQL